MTDNELIEKALLIALEAHKGQKDKAGAPYIFHPIRVALRCSTVQEKIVALLPQLTADDLPRLNKYLAAYRLLTRTP